MNSVELLARMLRGFIKVCRFLRIAPAVSMPDADIAANAHGLSYAILATRWQRKTAAPAWTAVYRHWRARLPETGSPSFCGSFDPADRFELLTDNAAAFDLRHRLYRDAKQSIDISTYYMMADEVGLRTAEALVDCVKRGVRVRIVADLNMTMRKNFENPNVLGLVRDLRQAGVDYRLFETSSRPYDICHHKLLIVDGTALITGSRNYAKHYAENEWRDLDLLLAGPSVAHVQQTFERTFAGCADIHEAATRGNLFQPNSPSGIADNAFFIYLLECIRACRKTLDIENAYYLKHAEIHQALAEACRRGVRVRLFTNSAESNDIGIMNYRLYAGFPDLIDAGVLLYLRRGKGRTLHSKFFVADGEWVGFGSSNLDYFSPRCCLELNIHVRDAGLGGQLSAWFEQGIAEAELMTDPAVAEGIAATQNIGRIFDRWLPDMQ
jgi:cardiolipin synthase